MKTILRAIEALPSSLVALYLIPRISSGLPRSAGGVADYLVRIIVQTLLLCHYFILSHYCIYVCVCPLW